MLHVGYAQLDITPPQPRGILLGGFGFARAATGVRDPLWARAMAVGTGRSDTVVFVGVDCFGLFADTIDRILALLKAAPRDRTIVSATHTHAAPDTVGYFGPAIAGEFPIATGVDDAYLAYVVERTADAADAAVAAMRPAVLSTGAERLPARGLVYNTHEPEWYDRRVTVLHAAERAADGAPGRAIVTLVSFACHPEVLWSENTRISSDFAHALRTRLEALTGGPALYVQGALGGMVTPDTPPYTPLEKREALCDAVGAAAADIAHAAVRRAAPVTEAPQHAAVTVELPIENLRFRIVHRLGVMRRTLPGGRAVSRMHLVRIGSFAALTTPGEPLPAVGDALAALTAQSLGGDRPAILGLAGDEVGYILPRSFFGRADYRYEASMSTSPGAAALLYEAAGSLAMRLGGRVPPPVPAGL